MVDIERSRMMEQIREAFEKNSENVKCTGCSSELFVSKTKIRRVSPVVSPTGQELVMPAEVYICDSCGKELTNHGQ